MPSKEEIFELDRQREEADRNKVVVVPRMVLSDALYIAISSVEPEFGEKYSKEERQRAVDELKRLYQFLFGGASTPHSILLT